MPVDLRLYVQTVDFSACQAAAGANNVEQSCSCGPDGSVLSISRLRRRGTCRGGPYRWRVPVRSNERRVCTASGLVGPYSRVWVLGSPSSVGLVRGYTGWLKTLRFYHSESLYPKSVHTRLLTLVDQPDALV